MQVLLKAGTTGADEIAQRAYVRAVSADATRIDRQAEHLGLLDAQTSVVKFGEAITFGGHNSIAARKRNRPRRTMTNTAPLYNIEEVVPITPGPHSAPPIHIATNKQFDAQRTKSVARIYNFRGRPPQMRLNRLRPMFTRADDNPQTSVKSHEMRRSFHSVIYSMQSEFSMSNSTTHESPAADFFARPFAHQGLQAAVL